MTVRITATFTNVYDGVEHERTVQLDVADPPPGEITDPDMYDEWADSNLRPHTGDGNAADRAAGYFVTVDQVPGFPHMEGLEFTWGV